MRIKLSMQDFNVKINRSFRRSISAKVDRDGTVLVNAPISISDEKIKEFIVKHEKWFVTQIKKSQSLSALPKFSLSQLNEMKKTAKELIPKRVEEIAKTMSVGYSGISLRFQRTLWGSCTCRGKLSFNCLLVNTGKDIVDYVIIHELSHRKHMNHSKNFWLTVERFCPNYKECRKWLKQEGVKLLYRLP